MTIVDAATGAILFDFLKFMGFSLCLWFGYHLLCLLFRMRSKIIAVLLHLLYFSVAGFACFCFILGETASIAPRWHHVAGIAAGALAYYGWFARYMRSLFRLIKKLLHYMVLPIRKFLAFVREKILLRFRDWLQSKRQLMYNFRKKKQEERAARRQKHAEPEPSETPKKAPIQAYTKT